MTRLNTIANVLRLQFFSWFDLCALLLYAYISITSNLTGNGISTAGIVVNLVLFILLVLIDHICTRKSIDAFEFGFNWSKNLVFPVYFFSTVVLDSVDQKEFFIQITPFLLCCHFWILVKNSEKTNDRWLRVQNSFSKYAKERKILVLKPIKTEDDAPGESLGLTRFVAITPKGGLGYQTFDFFESSLREVDFQHTSFLFQNNHTLNQSKNTYEIPSNQSFQFLDNSANLTPGYGMQQLQLNTLTLVFISSFFSDLNHRNVYSATNLSKYVSNRKKFHYEFRLDGEENVGSSHKWLYSELGLVSTKILDAFFSVKKNRDSKRIEQLMEKNLLLISKNSPLYIPIINSFIVLLSKLVESEEGNHSHEFYVGALETFSETVRIISENILQSEDIISYQYEISSANALRNDLLNRQNDLQRFGDNVTEFFISMHDKLVKLLEESEEAYKIENLCFDRFIQNMITKLGTTNFKQQRVDENKYTLSQLIELRTGIVLGTVVAIKILIDFIEG